VNDGLSATSADPAARIQQVMVEAIESRFQNGRTLKGRKSNPARDERASDQSAVLQKLSTNGNPQSGLSLC
jgi:hypothetical protein